MSRTKEAVWDSLLELEQQQTNEKRCEGGCTDIDFSKLTNYNPAEIELPF